MNKDKRYMDLSKFPEKPPESPAPEMNQYIQAYSNATISPSEAKQEDTNSQTIPDGKIKLRIPKSLHKQLLDQADVEGVPFSEYLIFKLTQK